MKSVAAAALALFGVLPAAVAQEATAATVLVATAPAQKGTLEETVTGYGLVQATPGASLNLSLPQAGQVLGLRVTAGQPVAKGQALFEYSADPAAILAYQKAVSALTLAQQQRAHTAGLVAQKLATQAQLDQADQAVRDAEAEVAAERRLGGGQTSETVTAPFAGIVTALAVGNGDRVQANTTLLRLEATGQLDAVIALVPEEATHLTPGMAVRLSPLPQPGPPVAASVGSVAGALDPKTQLIDVVVPVPAESAIRFLPGEHVEANIIAGQASGWIVPRQAVLSDQRGPYLFQVADGKAVRVDVSIAGAADERLVVAGLLDPARPLVVSGNYELSDGMAVREQASGSRQAAGGNPQ